MFSEPRFNLTMSSYWCRKPHYGDKAVVYELPTQVVGGHIWFIICCELLIKSLVPFIGTRLIKTYSYFLIVLWHLRFVRFNKQGLVVLHFITTFEEDCLIKLQWASCQILKIAGCAGNARNVFPITELQRKLLISDLGMHHGTWATHVAWCMSGSLTRSGTENVPGIPEILCIWQEVH